MNVEDRLTRVEDICMLLAGIDASRVLGDHKMIAERQEAIIVLLEALADDFAS